MIHVYNTRGGFVDLSEKNIRSKLPLEAPQFSTSLMPSYRERTEIIVSLGNIDTPIFVVLLVFLCYIFFHPLEWDEDGVRGRKQTREGGIRSTEG